MWCRAAATVVGAEIIVDGNHGRLRRRVWTRTPSAHGNAAEVVVAGAITGAGAGVRRQSEVRRGSGRRARRGVVGTGSRTRPGPGPGYPVRYPGNYIGQPTAFFRRRYGRKKSQFEVVVGGVVMGVSGGFGRRGGDPRCGGDPRRGGPGRSIVSKRIIIVRRRDTDADGAGAGRSPKEIGTE